MRLSGAAITVLTQIIIARNLGAEFLAEFLLIIAIANVSAVLLPLGFQSIASYFAADYASKNEFNRLISFRNHAYLFIVTLSIFLTLVFWSLQSIQVSMFQNFTSTALLLALTLAPAIALTFVNSGILVGLRQPFLSLGPDTLARPIIFLISVSFPIYIFSEPASLNMLWIAVIFIWCLALCQAYLLKKLLNEKLNYPSTNQSELKRWFKYAGPWIVIGLISDFFIDLDLIALSGILEKNELAIFGVSLKFLMLIGFAMSTIYTLILPDIFESLNKNLSTEMLAKIRQASWLSCLIGCLALVGLSLLGNWALSLFGPEFKAGLIPLMIMTTGLILRMMMGPASLVLSLYESPFASLPILLLGLLLMIVSNYLLIPSFGLTGAALAIFTTLAFWSIGLWFITIRKTGLNISVFHK